MRSAIELARTNPRRPFATLLVDVRDNRVVAKGVNRAGQNPVMHGEVVAISTLADEDDKPNWKHLCMYTTAEPCPMCQSAVLWAGIGAVVYGSSIQTLTGLGWRQIGISCQEVVERASFAQCEITGGVLEAECDQLMRDALQYRQ
jgi:tRNA(Arg) A34 adenosine deaminase TadA